MKLAKFAVFALVTTLTSIGAEDAFSAIRYKGLTSAEYQNAFNTWVPQGYRPTYMRGYSRAGRARYDVTLERKGGPAWVARHKLNDDQFRVTSQQLAAQGYVVKLYSAFRVNGRQQHMAYWERP